MTACSWSLEMLVELRQRAGVFDVVRDMCMFRLVSRDGLGESPAMKPTRILKNYESIADMLRVRCDHSHRNVQLMSGRAAAAQGYPEAFCAAIVGGLKHHIL